MEEQVHVIPSITSYHMIPYHRIPYHRIPYHMIPYHMIPYHIISYYIPYHIILYIISYYISYHIISYHIISYHIISYHIISYHIISYIKGQTMLCFLFCSLSEFMKVSKDWRIEQPIQNEFEISRDKSVRWSKLLKNGTQTGTTAATLCTAYSVCTAYVQRTATQPVLPYNCLVQDLLG